MLIQVTVDGFVKDPDSEDGSHVLNLTEEGGTRTFSIHVLPRDPLVREIAIALLGADPTITVAPSLEVQKFLETLKESDGKMAELIIRQVDEYEIDGEDDYADIVARVVLLTPYGTKKFIDVLLVQGIILALHTGAKIYIEQALFDIMSFDWGGAEGQNKKRRCPTCGYAEDQPPHDAETLRRHIRSVDVLDIGNHTIKDVSTS